ncbi:MAG: YciI family protein [Oscillospiraceae bacterium]|nr:YciI family protein [Oscillospiraceae bacterium]
MHFLITAFDGKDSEASMRRKNVREQHLEGVKNLIKERKHLYAAAILDDENNMIGSIMIVDYPSKEILINEWLNSEPYVTGNVWQEIDIKPCRVPDFLLDRS